MLAEAKESFRLEYAASIKRRGLSSNDRGGATRRRNKVNDAYRKWLRLLTSDDIDLMLMRDEVVEAVESARHRGYRTPHK
jgi:hypothetical protein